MKKIGLICLALILALGTVGVGYALWYEDLYIDVLVQTGDVDVEWSIEAWGADGDWKDVSFVDPYIIGDTLYIDIYNAYPSVTYWVDWDIHSTGSIPVHIGDFQVDWDGIPPVAIDYGFEYYGPWQLHEGDTGYGTWWLHFDNNAEENAVYTFYATVTAGQYNEFAPGGP